MNDYNSFSETELIDLLKSGDHVAFTEIFNRYSPLLYSHAYNKLRKEADARDIVQDIFINLWDKRSALNLQSNLLGYLYVAVRNAIFNQFKHKKIADTYVAAFSALKEDVISSTDYLIRTKQLEALIEAEIAALPPRMREVFKLRRIENLSIKEVALKLHISEATVTDQMKKALRVLRIRIGLAILVTYLFHF